MLTPFGSRRDPNNIATHSPYSQSSLNATSNGRTSSSASSSSLTPSNKYVSNSTGSKYQPSEMPWSSLLASASRYPVYSKTSSQSKAQNSSSNSINTANTIKLSSTSTTNASNQIYLRSGRPLPDNNSSYTATRRPAAIPARYEPKSLSSTTATSAYISGRSLFDYAAPRTALNTPASRIYDGQLRRTVTAKYIRNEPPLVVNKKEPAQDQAYFKSPTATNLSLNSKATKSSQPDAKQVLPESRKGNVENKAITASQHLRSKSLKLRTSYGNILDQIASATFARLRLGSSQNSHTSTPVSSTNDLKEKQLKQQHRQSNLKQPALEVVPDVPEAESDALRVGPVSERARCPELELAIANDYLTSKVTGASSSATSPGSSSSGLSSSGVGLVCSSPTSSTARSPVLARSTVGCLASRHKSTELRAIDSADDESNNDSANCGCSSGASESAESEENVNEDEEQKTLMSPVAANQNFDLNNDEANLNPEEPKVRDNLLKTGAILAELDDFDENDALDQYSDDDASSCAESQSDDITTRNKVADGALELESVPQINESVMVALRDSRKVGDEMNISSIAPSKPVDDESSEYEDDDVDDDNDENVGGESYVDGDNETGAQLGNYIDEKVSC